MKCDVFYVECFCVGWIMIVYPSVYLGVFLCFAVFIEVIHAGVIDGNHFTAKLYCNYGDERLLFRDTNTE